MHHLNSLHNLFIEELKDLYNAETQLVEALPKMAGAASTNDLKQAFEHHLEETQEHVRRLDNIFREMGESPAGKTCEAMKGLVKEGEEVIKASGDAKVKDAALIAAAQRVEHYEMAGYGAVRTYAKELGYNNAQSLLNDTLKEEGNADSKLTKLATGGFLSSGINKEAKQLA